MLIITPCTWAICQSSKRHSNKEYVSSYSSFFLLVSGVQVMTDPLPVEYDSGRTLRQDELGLDNPSACSVGQTLICLTGNTPIDNDDNGPVNLTDLKAAYAWNLDVTIRISLNGRETQVTGINLFFYNIPSMGIGLPHGIEVNWGTSAVLANNRLYHTVLGNQDLSRDDHTLRNVTIATIATDGDDNTDYTSISIEFHFSDANQIRWLILTEIQICDMQGIFMYIRACKDGIIIFF